ncbi:Ankyrin repeat family protein [Perilla frutescens var. hirtella]|uniref:Ankyrin repeat family protein n=1 Tax=Perilla frutescens var. hirtella TaxID=608512 RepID=A0AAD4JDU5_PERFH|nr:Ankyrin repeat family protein [Perilla frutescens var. hirtella]
MSKSSTAATVVRPLDYADSPAHYAVATGDHATLTKLISLLPKLSDPNRIHTEPDSLAEDRLAERISAVLDRRDNRLRETPLHLAVRLNDVPAARALAAAGADISLQNAAGWNPLQEALLRRCPAIVPSLVQHHHLAAWSKWRRRLPRLVAAVRRMRDFYMEISFHFESSVVPFVGKIAPSDTYKIWKRDGNLRADTSLAGYDGLKIQRANQSFLFLNDVSNDDIVVPEGSLLILNHDKKKISNAFENAGDPLSDADISNFCGQTSVYRPGMDVTKAELIGRTNWRRQEKTESVGEWKARVYEMHNVLFTFRSRKVAAAAAENRDDSLSPTCILPLEIDEESDDGFIVAENPRFSVSADYQRRHSSFVGEGREFVSVSRKSVDIIPRRALSRPPPPCTADRLVAPPRTKEKEFAKSLRPTVWLTEQFPLKTEELLPLLDILANKIKTVRRLRDLLTTTFPSGTFPVKVAVPVIPTVRVVITFTKFVELQPTEYFYTPLSSPRQFATAAGSEDDYLLPPSKGGSGGGEAAEDPFVIPSGYVWSSSDDKYRKMKRSKSIRRTK